MHAIRVPTFFPSPGSEIFPQPPWGLLAFSDGRTTVTYELSGSPYTVGSSSQCSLLLEHATVSDLHFALSVERDADHNRAPSVLIEDVSVNGTWLNGVRLVRGVHASLRTDDVVTVPSEDAATDLIFVLHVLQGSQGLGRSPIEDTPSRLAAEQTANKRAREWHAQRKHWLEAPARHAAETLLEALRAYPPTPGLDAVGALRTECARTRSLLDRLQATVAAGLRPDERAILAERDAARAKHVRTLRALCTDSTDLLRADEAALRDDAAELDKRCARLNALCEHASDATDWCSTATAAAVGGEPASLPDARAHAQSMVDVWFDDLETRTLLGTTDAMAASAWAALAAVGATAGGDEGACEAWRTALAHAHRAMAAEAAARAIHWAVALPARPRVRAAVRSLRLAAVARTAWRDTLQSTAAEARQLVLDSRAELGNLRVLPVDAADLALEAFLAAKQCALLADDSLLDAECAAGKAELRGGDAACATARAELAEARRGAQEAVRARERAACRLVQLADGPLPELGPLLPPECSALHALRLPAARAALVADGRTVGHYEPDCWPDPSFTPTSARARVLPYRFEGRAVVLKECVLSSAAARRAFRREAEVLAGLSHAHVLRLEAVFSKTAPVGGVERAYLQFALCAGGSLERWLNVPPQLPPADAPRQAAGEPALVVWRPTGEHVALTHMRALRQLAEAVAYLHACGYAHGDVKLENALVSAAGGGWCVKLADFDLARAEARTLAPRGCSATTSNAGGNGTMGFMAPEVRQGGAPSADADVFALAVCVGRALAAEAAGREAVLQSVHGARTAAIALGHPLLAAALADERDARPSAAELLESGLFDAAEARLRAEGAARAAALRECAVCLDCYEPEDGLLCAGLGADTTDDGAHFACWECVSRHVYASCDEESLAAFGERGGRVLCVRSGEGCGRAYSEQRIARGCDADAFAAFTGARLSLREAQIVARLEQGVELRIQQQAARIAAMSAHERRTSEQLTHVIERILTLACPRCGQAFAQLLDGEVGFSGCCALKCPRAGCGCGFCAYCLQDCAGDAHAHVRECVHGRAAGGLFAQHGGFEAAQTVRRERMLRAFLDDQFEGENQADARAGLLVELAVELHDLGLDPHAFCGWRARGRCDEPS